jgi:hypothetical protein
MKMQKTIILLMFLMISIAAKSQSEQVNDTTKIDVTLPKTNELNTTQPTENNLYPYRLFPASNVDFYGKTIIGNNTKVFELPDFDYRLESYLARTTPNPLAVRTPLSYDFTHTGFMPLSRNSFLTAFQNRRTYMLIGTIESVGGNYNYQAGRFSLSTGVSVDKYRHQGDSKFDANLNAEINYLLSDRVTLNAFGMHSFSKSKDFYSRGMYGGRPQTYYGGNINFELTDNLYIQTGVYGANYSIGGNSKNDYGFRGEIGYWITDRVKIAGMGQYSVRNSYGSATQGMGGMYPQSYYGGYIEFKVTESFGVRGGATQQFDARKGKWVTVPYFEFVKY